MLHGNKSIIKHGVGLLNLAEELGNVLSFPAETMKIFPRKNKPYEVDSEWGTLIKLYEYNFPKRSHILMKDVVVK